MKAYIGDKVRCFGITATIAKIYYQECFDNEWDIEFIDDKGNYRHWKQYFDGGEFIPVLGEKYERVKEHVTDMEEITQEGVLYTLYYFPAVVNRFTCLVICRDYNFSRFFISEEVAKRYINGGVNK